MSPDRSALEIEEYRALRATIRERGTLRLLVTAITFVSWAILVVAVPAFLAMPILAMAPLLVLAAGFEIIFATHVGVERVGRFLQARYESGELPAWERSAMGIGVGRLPSAGVDPLFSVLFGLAALLNLVPVALLSAEGGPAVGAMSIEFLVYTAFHLVFLGRVIVARRFARTQRAADLAAFERRS
jgi:hypothetical protein